MIKKNYKKILVVGAALFILFAPVGMTMKNGTRGSITVPGSGAAAKGIAENIPVHTSPYSTFRISLILISRRRL